MKKVFNKIKILQENANHQGNISLKEFVVSQAESDPNFFRWLFDEDFKHDFSNVLSNKQRDEYNFFLKLL